MHILCNRLAREVVEPAGWIAHPCGQFAHPTRNVLSLSAIELRYSYVSVRAGQRRAILGAARRWLGTSYDDERGDLDWKDLSATPNRLDCSTFVCRIAMEALGSSPDAFAPDAGWLIDNLVPVMTPELGDLVAYGRAAIGAEIAMGYDRVWHVMLYAGNGMVIGACDAKRAVVIRPIDYKSIAEARRWRLVGDPEGPFRALEPRTH